MNLIELITSLSGYEYSSKRGVEFVGPCPFCLDGTDRFHIWLSGKIGAHYWCRVCGRTGGSIKFVMQLKGMDYHKTIEYLKSVDYDLSELSQDVKEWNKKDIYIPAPTKESECHVALDYSVIQKYHEAGRFKAYNYLKQWGLSLRAIDTHMFGWSIEINALTIPHFWIENDQYYVKGLKFRHMTNEHSHRFSQVTGGSLSGFWDTKGLLSNPDGSRIGSTLDYVFITEAEKDAALLIDLGYNAVSYLRDIRWNQHINTCLQNVIQPIIVADVDEKRQGQFSALQVQSYIKSHSIIVATDKENIKSPSDLAARDGVDAIHEWVKRLKIL